MSTAHDSFEESFDDSDASIDAMTTEKHVDETTVPNVGLEEDAAAAAPTQTTDDEDAKAKEKETAALKRQMQACVRNIAQSYCRLEAKGTRIVVTAQRHIPANTTVMFPGSETVLMPREVTTKLFENLSAAAKEHGEDVNFAGWYMQTYHYSCTGGGVAMPVAGFHALDMASYVRRTTTTSVANAVFKQPRLCVTSRDVPAGTELIALVPESEFKFDQARHASLAQERTARTGKAARRARHRARKKAQKEEKKRRRRRLEDQRAKDEAVASVDPVSATTATGEDTPGSGDDGGSGGGGESLERGDALNSGGSASN